MDSLNTILNSGTYGENVSRHNDNNSKIKQAITTLENVAIANKGYFDTLASLQAAFPSPKSGNIAYVANVASSTGYYIYNVVSGVWTATTTEAPAVGVAISNYAQHGYSSSPKTLKQVDDEIVQLAGISQEVKEKFPITLNDLAESTKQYIDASQGGIITNFPDEEDLTVNAYNQLQLRDKTFSPATFSGRGRKYMRKKNNGGKNVLTQEMFLDENFEYIIQYDYDLNGEEITIPRNCILNFQGGSIRNGKITLSDNCDIKEGRFIEYQLITLQNNCRVLDCIFNNGKDYLLVKGRNVIIDRCSFSGGYQPDNTYFAYIHTTYSHYRMCENLRIHNCTFTNGLDSDKNISASIVAIRQGSENFICSNNTFVGLDANGLDDRDGIYVDADDDIISEVFSNEEGYPYTPAGSALRNRQGCVPGQILNNRFSNVKSLKSCIKVAASGVAVTGNVINYVADYIPTIRQTFSIRIIVCDNCKVENNIITYFHRNSRAGILVEFSKNCDVIGNLIENLLINGIPPEINYSGASISFQQTQSCNCKRNKIISYNTDGVLEWIDSEDLTIAYNHLITSRSRLIYITTQTARLTPNRNQSTKFVNNTIEDVGNNYCTLEFRAERKLHIEGNEFKGNAKNKTSLIIEEKEGEEVIIKNQTDSNSIKIYGTELIKLNRVLIDDVDSVLSTSPEIRYANNLIVSNSKISSLILYNVDNTDVRDTTLMLLAGAIKSKEGRNIVRLYNSKFAKLIHADTMSNPSYYEGDIAANTSVYSLRTAGTTANRPPNLTTSDYGFQYFDTTLKKPIFWTGTGWIDAAGTPI